MSDATHDKREAESRISEARERLAVRLGEFARRVDKARAALDVPQLIRDRPLAAAALGLAAGLLTGLAGGRVTSSSHPGRLGALLAGVALQVARSRLSAWLEEALESGRGASAATRWLEPPDDGRDAGGRH